MVSGIESSYDGTSVTTCGSTVAKATRWQLSSGFGSRASVEFAVSEKQASGSAEVILSEDTDVKDDEDCGVPENNENTSDKDEQVKEVSGELKSGISTTAQQSASGGSITKETGLGSERSIMVRVVGPSETGFE